MAEQEELTLVVNLTDTASAGLVKLRQELAKIAGEAKQVGQEFRGGRGGFGGLGESARRARRDVQDLGAGGSLDRLKRTLDSLRGGSVKPLTEAFLGMGGGFATAARLGGVFAAGLGGLAAAAYGANRAMSEFNDQMLRWSQLRNQTGLPIGTLRNMANQMREVGLSTEQAESALSGLSAGMARFRRDRRSVEAEIRAATTPDKFATLQGGLQELFDTKAPEDFANKLVEIGEKIRASAPTPERGAQAQKQWLQFFGAEALQNFEGRFKAASADQLALQEKLNASAREYQAITTRIQTNWEAISNVMGATLVSKLKPALELLESLTSKFRSFMEERYRIERSPEYQAEANRPAERSPLDMLLGRALGGPVSGGTAYLVGERGPEIFVPNTGGRVVAHGGSRGFGGGGFGGDVDIDKNTEEVKENTEQLRTLNEFYTRLFAEGGGGAGGGRAIRLAALGGGGGFGTGAGTGPGGSAGVGGSPGGNVGSSPSTPPAQGPGTSLPPVSPDKLKPTLGAKADPRGMESYIRETAAKYGIDPDVAVRVARSEGLASFQSTVMRGGKRERSFGAFQLFTGGGLGNQFQKETGLDPSDPANERATIDWALKRVSTSKGKTGGWQPFHGAKNTGISQYQGIGAAPSKTPPIGSSPTPSSPDASELPPRVQAVGGKDPEAFIMHHTAGRGTIAGVQNTLRQRRLGVQYVMDRDGNIVQTGGPGASHIRPGQGPGRGLSNQNVVGMEIIAKNDADVTAAQRAAASRFIRERYPNTPVFGHGEVNPHKERTEGSSVVGDIRRERAAAAAARAAGRPQDALRPGWRSNVPMELHPGLSPQSSLDRRTLDRAQANSMTHQVNGTGKITVDVSAPRGTKVGAEGGGLFKEIEVNRNMQMVPAAGGQTETFA